MASSSESHCGPPSVEVVIEVSRGSFIKRGSRGQFDFLSPLPCPYNYGSVDQYIGGDGDYLDALVLGPRLARGSRVRVRALGAVGMSEREIYEDKLVCATRSVSAAERRSVLLFLRWYARCKSLLNAMRGKAGRVRFGAWEDAAPAIARARPVNRQSRTTRPGSG